MENKTWKLVTDNETRETFKNVYKWEKFLPCVYTASGKLPNGVDVQLYNDTKTNEMFILI